MKNEPGTGSYTLQSIPPDLWRRAKHVSVDSKISLRVMLLKALEEYLARRAKGRES